MSTRLRPGRRDWLGRTPGNNCRKRSNGAERSRKKQEEVERSRKKQEEAGRSRKKPKEAERNRERRGMRCIQLLTTKECTVRMSSVLPPYYNLRTSTPSFVVVFLTCPTCPGHPSATCPSNDPNCGHPTQTCSVPPRSPCGCTGAWGAGGGAHRCSRSGWW